jgi:hypothetical protein
MEWKWKDEAHLLGLGVDHSGDFSSVILGLIASLFLLPVTSSLASMPGYYEAPLSYIVTLTYIAKFVIFISLPLAIAIEAYLYLKGRKGEVEGNGEMA